MAAREHLVVRRIDVQVSRMKRVVTLNARLQPESRSARARSLVSHRRVDDEVVEADRRVERRKLVAA